MEAAPRIKEYCRRNTEHDDASRMQPVPCRLQCILVCASNFLCWQCAKMPSRNRNEFLEDDSSDEDAGLATDIEENEPGRGGIGGRGPKRRRVEAQDDEEYSSGLSEGDDVEEAPTSKTTVTRDASTRLELPTEGGDGTNEEDDDEMDAPEFPSQIRAPPSKLATPKSVAKVEKAARRSGVVYISRVPPFMKPHTLKHFLAPHAPKGLGRVFLTPEDHSAYLSRKKSGGNKKKSFTDGWVEFVSKTDAKVAAQTLNGNIIGGKKGGYYHDDLWNIKYLKGFKWSHLTEQVAAENAERDARLREEIRRTRQENRAFLEDVERGKMLQTMESKGKRKGEGGGGNGGSVGKHGPAREFRQAKATNKKTHSQADERPEVRRTLSMIF